MPLRSLSAPLLVLVSVFEMCAWCFDPLGVHSALNDGEPMGLPAAAAAAAVNGGVPLLLAWSVAGGRARVAAVAWPLMAVFCAMQTCFWWWPYLLGESAGVTDIIEEHKAQLALQPRILPRIGFNLVPDVEHTLLFPLSLLAFAAASSELLAGGAVARSPCARNTLAAVGAAASLLPLPLAYRGVSAGQPASRQLGPLLASAGVLVATVRMHAALRRGAARAATATAPKKTR